MFDDETFELDENVGDDFGDDFGEDFGDEFGEDFGGDEDFGDDLGDDFSGGELDFGADESFDDEFAIDEEAPPVNDRFEVPNTEFKKYDAAPTFGNRLFSAPSFKKR